MTAPFAWFDLAAQRTDEVATFYTDLFGWVTAPADAVGEYAHWLMAGDQPWAGITGADADRASSWVPFVQVKDLDAAAQRAMGLGAVLVRGRSAGPAGDSVVIADPAGAQLALWQPRP